MSNYINQIYFRESRKPLIIEENNLPKLSNLIENGKITKKDADRLFERVCVQGLKFPASNVEDPLNQVIACWLSLKDNQKIPKKLLIIYDIDDKARKTFESFIGKDKHAIFVKWEILEYSKLSHGEIFTQLENTTKTRKDLKTKTHHQTSLTAKKNRQHTNLPKLRTNQTNKKISSSVNKNEVDVSSSEESDDSTSPIKDFFFDPKKINFSFDPKKTDLSSFAFEMDEDFF